MSGGGGMGSAGLFGGLQVFDEGGVLLFVLDGTGVHTTPRCGVVGFQSFPIQVNIDWRNNIREFLDSDSREKELHVETRTKFKINYLLEL